MPLFSVVFLDYPIPSSCPSPRCRRAYGDHGYRPMVLRRAGRTMPPCSLDALGVAAIIAIFPSIVGENQQDEGTNQRGRVAAQRRRMETTRTDPGTGEARAARTGQAAAGE